MRESFTYFWDYDITTNSTPFKEVSGDPQRIYYSHTLVLRENSSGVGDSGVVQKVVPFTGSYYIEGNAYLPPSASGILLFQTLNGSYSGEYPAIRRVNTDTVLGGHRYNVSSWRTFGDFTGQVSESASVTFRFLVKPGYIALKISDSSTTTFSTGWVAVPGDNQTLQIARSNMFGTFLGSIYMTPIIGEEGLTVEEIDTEYDRRLDFKGSLEIIDQSESVVAELGSPVKLHLIVDATVATTTTYQWFLNNIAISGATSCTYDIPSVTTNSYGTYLVRIGSNQYSDSISLNNGSFVLPVKETSFDALGNIWSATPFGLKKAKRSNGSFEVDAFTRKSTFRGIPSNNLTCISVGNDGSVWIGTATSGVVSLPQVINLGMTNPWSRYYSRNTLNFVSDQITAIAYDSVNSGVWIGTLDAGLMFLDFNNSEVPITLYDTSNSILESNKINDIYVNRHTVLIGTGIGAYSFDLDTTSVLKIAKNSTIKVDEFRMYSAIKNLSEYSEFIRELMR
jgi:hypothetical protein